MRDLRRFPLGPISAPSLQYYPMRNLPSSPHVRPFTLTYR